MALSNILREPRREITESAIGIGVVGIVAAGNYLIAINSVDAKHHFTAVDAFAALLVLEVAFGVALVVFLVVTHAFGDWICNRFQAVGVHLRPRQRR